ncbi:unnamed protein product [Durusdinium trenchii]|uniref:Uncharacterized protein n=1 Tax=Durusdinium trenchii TaxID=1381693 RepID=A0ABP0S0Q2_9DINO
MDGKFVLDSGPEMVDPDDAGETDLTIDCIWKDKRHSVEISIEETVDLAKAWGRRRWYFQSLEFEPDAVQ